MGHERSQAGFGLLEVLVALAIVMITLTAMFGAGLSALRGTQAAVHRERAASLARSYLDLASVNLVPGERSGDAGDGFSWHVVTHPMGTAHVAPSGAPQAAWASAPIVTLYSLSVRVSWRDGGGGGVERIESRRLSTTFPGR